MLYRRLANLIVVIHAAICVYALGGAVLVLVEPWTAAVHIPLITWVCAANIMGWKCPLTPLENRLRTAASDDAYESTFIGRYLLPILVPDAEPDEHRTAVARVSIAVALLNAGFYLAVLPGLMADPVQD